MKVSQKKPHKGKQRKYIWHYQPSANNPDTVMLDFMQNYPYSSFKDLVLEALRAFYFSLACVYEGSFDEQQLKMIGEKAVFTLQRQADYISFALKLDTSANSQSWRQFYQQVNPSSFPNNNLPDSDMLVDFLNFVKNRENLGVNPVTQPESTEELTQEPDVAVEVEAQPEPRQNFEFNDAGY